MLSAVFSLFLAFLAPVAARAGCVQRSAAQDDVRAHAHSRLKPAERHQAQFLRVGKPRFGRREKQVYFDM